MNFFSRLFSKALPKSIKRSTKSGEYITEDEKELWREHNGCPDCRGKMGMGPEASCNINVACTNCGSEFNVTPGLMFAERISDRGKPRIDHLRQFYGIEIHG